MEAAQPNEWVVEAVPRLRDINVSDMRTSGKKSFVYLLGLVAQSCLLRFLSQVGRFSISDIRDPIVPPLIPPLALKADLLWSMKEFGEMVFRCL